MTRQQTRSDSCCASGTTSRYQDEDDFTVLSQEDLMAIYGQITGVLTIFLGAIAGISLLVGGIGIMNIMLVIGHRAHARDRPAQGRRRHTAATS